MKYAVIDVSSSSVSFIVATVSGTRTEIIFRDRVGLSLYHYLEGKTLSARGAEKFIETVLKVKEKCVALGVDKVYLISTAALRAIDNFDEIQALALERTGMKVNLIDGETEAYCDYIANGGYSVYERPVLIDLGGASIEICDLSENAENKTTFLNFGMFNLSRKFVKKIQPTESEAKDIKEYLKEKYAKAGLCKEGVYSTAILVGATNRAIFDVYCDYAEVAEGECGKYIDVKKFKKFAKTMLCGDDRSMLIMNNAPERVYILGAAVITLKTLLKRFDVDEVIVSDLGVKEGYLRLILDGKAEGEAYTFNEENKGPSEKPAKRKYAKKNKSTKKSKKEAQPAQEAAEPVAEAAEPAQEAEAPAAKPKRRYTRRKKVAPAEETVKAAEEPAETIAAADENTENEGKENDGEERGEQKEE